MGNIRWKLYEKRSHYGRIPSIIRPVAYERSLVLGQSFGQFDVPRRIDPQRHHQLVPQWTQPREWLQYPHERLQRREHHHGIYHFLPFFGGGGNWGLEMRERRDRCLFDWLIATLSKEEENAFYHVDIVFHSFLLFNFRLKMLCTAGDANRSQLLRDLPLHGHKHSRQGRTRHWIAWRSSSWPSSPP